MKIKLIFAIITITLALIFYTIGVFLEKKNKTLKKEHVIIFWLGLIFDTTGTTIMSTISNEGSIFSLHGITRGSCYCINAISCYMGNKGIYKKE